MDCLLSILTSFRIDNRGNAYAEFKLFVLLKNDFLFIHRLKMK